MPKQPMYPVLHPDQEPTLEEMATHNLAHAAEALQTIADRLDGLCAIGERISQHLFDLKRGR